MHPVGHHPLPPLPEAMLRRATRADIDVMASIHAAAFARSDAWSRDVFDLQLQMPNVFALMHSSGGLILVRTAADEAEILTLAVVPKLRRGGIGSALLREATTVAAALGVHAVFLEVSTENSVAQRLYTRTGFTLAGRRPHYYSDRSDALVLRLDLSLPE